MGDKIFPGKYIQESPSGQSPFSVILVQLNVILFWKI